MKRKCTKLSVESMLTEFPDLRNKKVELYIDTINANDIENFLVDHHKKFRIIIYSIFSNSRNNDLYGQEKKAKNIYAMKFSNKENIRIYCKEYIIDGKKIVMICKSWKKTEGNNKKLNNTLKTIGDYDYEF
ncbi:MAG: hypothetical protein Q8903_08215 [Bacteroidota bacterium]|nr:hypothetical protein [Bacteroidota bacterium]